MTHNKKKQDWLYFKGIIDEYHIDLKISTKDDVCNDLKVIVLLSNKYQSCSQIGSRYILD